MPIAYHIDAGRQLVETTMTGAVSGAEIAAYHSRLFTDPAYLPKYRTLTDARAMETVLTAAEVRQLAAALDRRAVPPGTRRAVVVGSEAAYGMLRMFAALTGGDASPYRGFRTMEEARAWLGNSED
jgi:hypothetical protein